MASSKEDQMAVAETDKGPVKTPKPDKVDVYSPEQLGLQPNAETDPAGSPTGA